MTRDQRERLNQSPSQRVSAPQKAAGHSSQETYVESIRSAVKLAGLGELQRFVPLKSRASGESEPLLLQTSRGVWLGCTERNELREMQDLTAVGADLRYEASAKGDRLCAFGATYAIRVGRGKEVKTAVGLGRLLAAGNGSAQAELSRTRFVEDLGEIEEVWLRQALEPDEILLAWLRTASLVAIPSTILPGSKAEARFLLTDQRSEFVAISDIGDVLREALPSEALVVSDELGRDSVAGGERIWRSTLTNDSLYRELADIPPLDSAERVRKVALRSWLLGGKNEVSARQAHELLDLLSATGRATPLDLATRAILSHLGPSQAESEEALDDAVVQLSGLARTPATAEEAGVWFCDWEFPWELGGELLKRLLADNVDSALTAWTIPFHRAARRAIGIEAGKDLRVSGDLRLAEHLVQAGQPLEAISVLEGVLPLVPEVDTEDLLTRNRDETAAYEQRLRLVVLERLAEAEEAAGQAATNRLAQLACLEPLDRSRLIRLAEHSDDPLRQRAMDVSGIFEPASLQRIDASPSPPPLQPLNEDQLVLLQHPAARQMKAVSFLERQLEAAGPDVKTLKSFAVRVTSKEQPHLSRAIDDTVLMLGLSSVRGFVSKGDRNIGIHAHEATDILLLVGDQHLDPSSPHYLSPPELRFAVASELSHVRFGHARLTSNDIWRGALDLGRVVLSFGPIDQGIEAVLGGRRFYQGLRKVVPLSALKMVTGQSDGRKVISKLGGASTAMIRSGVERAAQYFGGRTPTGSTEEAVAPEPSDLLSAFRRLCWSADRAGLLLCNDLRSAVRAIFLTSTTLASELSLAERHGLLTILTRRGKDGDLLREDLMLRLAALFSFYLSEDFEGIRKTVLKT